MLDVEFLLNPEVSTATIYRYRSGALVVPMKRAIEKVLARQGLQLRTASAQELRSGLLVASLFDQFVPYCESHRGRNPDGIVSALRSRERVVVFAAQDARVFSDPSWPDIEAGCHVVEEPFVTEATLSAVMRYFWAETDMPFCPLDGTKFNNEVSARLGDEYKLELHEFWYQLEGLLADYNEDLGRFSAVPEGRELETRVAVLRPLRKLVQKGEAGEIDQVVQGLSARLQKREWTAEKSVRELYRLTRDLLPADCLVPIRPSLLIWAVLVLIEGRRLSLSLAEVQETLTPRADILLTAFDRICRNFHSRFVGSLSDNPVADCWHDLAVILTEFSKPSADGWPTQEERMLLELARTLEGLATDRLGLPWIKRLSFMVIDAAGRRRQWEEALEV